MYNTRYYTMLYHTTLYTDGATAPARGEGFVQLPAARRASRIIVFLYYNNIKTNNNIIHTTNNDTICAAASRASRYVPRTANRLLKACRIQWKNVIVKWRRNCDAMCASWVTE